MFGMFGIGKKRRAALVAAANSRSIRTPDVHQEVAAAEWAELDIDPNLSPFGSLSCTADLTHRPQAFAGGRSETVSAADAAAPAAAHQPAPAAAAATNEPATNGPGPCEPSPCEPNNACAPAAGMSTEDLLAIADGEGDPEALLRALLEANGLPAKSRAPRSHAEPGTSVFAQRLAAND